MAHGSRNLWQMYSTPVWFKRTCEAVVRSVSRAQRRWNTLARFQMPFTDTICYLLIHFVTCWYTLLPADTLCYLLINFVTCWIFVDIIFLKTFPFQFHITKGIFLDLFIWPIRESNPGGGEIFRTCPDQPWGPPSLLTMGTWFFPGVRCGRGVTLTPHPLLVPRSKIQ
jgi:hypothetical protein